MLGIARNKIWEPRIYLFSTTSQLNGKFEATISDEERDRDNQKRALETTGFPKPSRNFTNVGSLTAKIEL